MIAKLLKLMTAGAVGALLAASPGLLSKHPLSYDQAAAERGGQGKGGGGGHGQGSDHSAASAAKAKDTTTAKAPAAVALKKKKSSETASHGKLASKLGALNAAHASAKAFAHASPNSRVGRIAAYYEANKLSEEAREAAAEAQAEADAAKAEYDKALDGVTDAEAKLKAAEEALAGDPDNPDLQKAVEAAKAELASAESAADTAKTEAEREQAEADEAAKEAETADAAALAALEAAANKNPVDDETRAALDQLLAGKFPEDEEEEETTE